MAAWTPELKEQVIQLYKDADPTPESSTEIIKDIAEQLDQSPNGVRQVLVQAGVYVKKEVGGAAKTPGKTTTKTDGEGSKRVSKESQIDALRAAITAAGAIVDEDIISKLTGKAATYFAGVLAAK
jgi:transposase-like protein